MTSPTSCPDCVHPPAHHIVTPAGKTTCTAIVKRAARGKSVYCTCTTRQQRAA